MTLIRSLISGQKVEVILPDGPLSQRMTPKRYDVIVQTGLSKWDWKIGYLTTSLDLDTWQRMHPEFHIMQVLKEEECTMADCFGISLL